MDTVDIKNFNQKISIKFTLFKLASKSLNFKVSCESKALNASSSDTKTALNFTLRRDLPRSKTRRSGSRRPDARA